MSDLPLVVRGLDVNEAEDGLIVYDPDRDRVHHLNASAATVFLLCDGSRDSAGIVDAVGKAYGLDDDPVAEVEACLTQLRDEGLLQ